MKKLTVQEMTESQQLRVKTHLDQARKSLGRPLTNAENNRIKDEIVTQISREVEKAAAKLRAEKRKQKLKPSEETYNWSAKNHSRGLR